MKSIECTVCGIPAAFPQAVTEPYICSSCEGLRSQDECAGDDFPERARMFLNAFYNAKGVAEEDVPAKMSSLCLAFDMVKATFTAGSGTPKARLKVAEFYALTKLKII